MRGTLAIGGLWAFYTALFWGMIEAMPQVASGAAACGRPAPRSPSSSARPS